MFHKSTSIDPVSDLDLRTENFPGGAWVVRNNTGEIIRSSDALGVVREFGKEAITGKMLVRKHGIWTKMDGGCLDSSGTLFYRRGDVEIQERLSGVHVHINKKTGVMIQTDHVNHSEIMKQANGEVWKREVDEVRELFEMWMDGKLSFRTITYFNPTRCEIATPSGKQPLVYVCRREQSWSNGQISREKCTFRNPLNQHREVTLTVPMNGKLMTLKNVMAVITSYVAGTPNETSYELNGGTNLRVDLGSGYRDMVDVERVRHFADGQERMLSFATTGGAEAVFTARW
jgi:hypothetical protein